VRRALVSHPEVSHAPKACCLVFFFMVNGLYGVKKNLVRKSQKLYKVLIFAQLLIKQKLKEIY
jgi:hypothetical protein